MALKDALIGNTGFVGSNLTRQHKFDCFYNSRDINTIIGKQFRRIVCCGASATKWLVNKNPEEDWLSIQKLMSALSGASAEEIVLISTIDVYPESVGGCEETTLRADLVPSPYGKHRLALEDFCTEQFSKCHIVRLPGLIGEGLKKNVIYDLIHDNSLENVQPASMFQYYDLSSLWCDIDEIVSKNISLINLFSEPVCTRDIIKLVRPELIEYLEKSSAHAVHYDIQTRYGAMWGRADHYYSTKEEMLERIVSFIKVQRG